jgi:tetratricopeptide (TPR) repeat protein
MKSLVLGLLVATAACGARSTAPKRTFPDAPLELRDDTDRDQAIDRLWVMPHGAARDQIRAGIADAIARRIGDALEEDKPFVAEQLVFQLASLWQDDPEAAGKDLADHQPLLEKLRATFAKSGAIEPTIACLALLAEIDGSHRDQRLAELDEILKFADDMAAAENGADAQRAQPINLLQPTVLVLPLPWLVDRYVGLLEERQRVIATLIVKQGASIQLVRAHHDILSTAHRIAAALARTGHTEDIAAHLARLTNGIGTDREIAARAEVVASQPSPDAYIQLAALLRKDEHGPDPVGALAVCLAGLAKFPHDASLLEAAADHATALGRIDQPIALYEAALAGAPVDATTARKLGSLYAERIARLAFGGRPAAAKTAWHELEQTSEQQGRRGQSAAWTEVEAAADIALGKGMLSQGRVGEAEAALTASLELAPSADAYETLATIHYKTNRLASAGRYANKAIALYGSDLAHRARLERIAGDVARAAGRPRDAAMMYLTAMHDWSELLKSASPQKGLLAEGQLEAGRGLWYLGHEDRAVDLVLSSTEEDADSGPTFAAAVAFLIEVGRPVDALDALHRALSADVSELYKVYMCLWVVADERRRGDPKDRQAIEYLQSRHGNLWYELLAEAETGRLEWPALAAAATTAPRQSELAFYGVVLGLDPDATTPAAARKKLIDVIQAGLVMDAEYDLARQFLTPP